MQSNPEYTPGIHGDSYNVEPGLTHPHTSPQPWQRPTSYILHYVGFLEAKQRGTKIRTQTSVRAKPRHSSLPDTLLSSAPRSALCCLTQWATLDFSSIRSSSSIHEEPILLKLQASCKDQRKEGAHALSHPGTPRTHSSSNTTLLYSHTQSISRL